MEQTVSELARKLGLNFQGNGNQSIRRVSGWDEAGKDCLIFRDKAAKKESFPAELPAACIMAPISAVLPGWNAILSEKPKLDFARAAHILNPRPTGQGRHHSTAVVAKGASIGNNVDLGAHVSVGEEAYIGDGSILYPGVVVGENCVLGENCILFPHVCLYPGVVLGDRVILHAGVIAGGDGFGYVFDGQTQVKFPQAGKVIISDDVEIGANTTIDRGSLGITRIGKGTKIDNLVQIAHNVQIGEGVVIAAQTGISGSSVIEDFAVIGGQVGFGDHTHVQKGAIIGSKAGILPGKIVRGGEVYWGVPIRPLNEYKRLNALFGRLPEMKAEIDTLKAEVHKLKNPK